MLLIIPLVEIHEHYSKLCIQGEHNAKSFYEYLKQDPGELCKLLRKENSKTVHISDTDSLFNEDKIDTNLIFSIVNSIDIPVQLYAGFKNIQDCKFYLNRGVYRIFLTKLLYNDPEIVKELVNEYSSSRIAFAYMMDKNIPDNEAAGEFINLVKSVGGDRILFCNSSNNDVISIMQFAERYKSYKLRITLQDAARTPEELWELQKLSHLGIDSIILGQPLYNNNFPCQKIWRLAEAELDTKKL